MAVLEVSGLCKDFGGDPLFEDGTFSIEPGEKLGFIGRNGCGKTTLLRILAGLDDDFKGTLRIAPGARVAYVPQNSPGFLPGETICGYLCRSAQESRRRLDELSESMASPDRAIAAAAMEEFGILRERYDALDGDQAEESSARLLERMGLGGRADVAAEALSGGEKNAIALAKAVMDRPDLLILDEPGNHLDLAGLAWLEGYLAGLSCAVLLVSHDRRLLDRVATSMLELEGRALKRHAGNYSAYRLQKLRDAAGQGQRWQADRKKIERLEALVRKFAEIARARPDPAWGKRLRARRSQLERERAQATERPDIGSRDANVIFRGEASKADLALNVRGYCKAFSEVELFREAEFTVLNGERVALVGPNGCGKTSFVRELVERGSWDDQCLRVGPSMVLGYCAQDQSVFEPDKTVEEAFLSWLPAKRDVFSLLSSFLFRYEDLDKRCSSLSGGELNRLQLARASALKANFLVLDEPTNHLDIPTREAVEDALEEFGGTALIVSHDRYFLEKVTDRVVFVEDRRFVEYEGSFAEYWRDVGSQRVPALGSGAGRDGASARLEDRGEFRRGARAGRPAAQRLSETGRKGALDLESRIGALERRREELERGMADAMDRRQFAESKRVALELEKNNRMLESLWESLMALS